MEIRKLNRQEITDLKITGHDIIVEELHNNIGYGYETGIWYAYFDGKKENGRRAKSIDEAIEKLAYMYSGQTVIFEDGLTVELPALQHTKLIL